MTSFLARVPGVHDGRNFTDPVVHGYGTSPDQQNNYRFPGCSNRIDQFFLVTRQRKHRPVLEFSFIDTNSYNSNIRLSYDGYSLIYFLFPIICYTNIPDQFYSSITVGFKKFYP